jgi:Leucine-rich repeat (LRR) protein
MPIPNLLEGKRLTGVLPPEKQPPLEFFLPQHNPVLLDIESCIDDPSLAPLGFHVKKRSTTSKKKKNVSNGQVYIENRTDLTSSTAGLVMLRRRGLETAQLAQELDSLLLPSPFIKTSFFSAHNEYTTLVELDISRNKLTDFPRQISQLTHLRILNATSNQLTEIPQVLFSLHHLQVLTLSQNQIQSIPEDMPRLLPNLVTFRIAANLISSLPSRLDYWHKMRHLQLGSVYGGNRLVQIPDSLTEMPRLEELDISYNRLVRLPHDLHLLQRLKILNVSSNQMDFIPKSIAQCYRLKSLNLSKNHLTSLPADLVNLRRLELLDISENLLCIMPAEILERMQSATLLITGNPLTRPGHCDQSSQDAYSRILRQMTQRGVPRSSPVSSPTMGSRELQCGPRGMGCLTPTVTSSSSVISSYSHSNFTTTGTASNSSSSSGSSSSGSSSGSSGSNSGSGEAKEITTAPPPFPLIHPHQDEDASIDQELSYHAQQLNIDGSRPLPPPTSTDYLIGTSRSKIVQDSTSTQYVLVDFPRQSPLPTETKLLHSLREIATRTILRNEMDVPLELLPQHIAQDISGGRNKCRSCSYCQGPFVNEWVTSVQVKSFGGHPAVVRRVRFCSTKCWSLCLPKDHHKSVICVHHQ